MFLVGHRVHGGGKDGISLMSNKEEMESGHSQRCCISIHLPGVDHNELDEIHGSETKAEDKVKTSPSFFSLVLCVCFSLNFDRITFYFKHVFFQHIILYHKHVFSHMF